MVEYLHQAKVTRPYLFVLALGDNCLCSQVFTIISGQALEQGTLFGALDQCFKFYYVFDINFPRLCAPAWEFLHATVYQLQAVARIFFSH